MKLPNPMALQLQPYPFRVHATAAVGLFYQRRLYAFGMARSILKDIISRHVADARRCV